MSNHTHNHHDHSHDESHHTTLITPKKWTDWLPLVTVIGYVIGMTAISTGLTEFTLNNLLTYSMGYFFLFFSLFKVIDLSGFAMGFQEYDLLAKRWPIWGYIYPFIEITLAALYLLRIDDPALHLATLGLSALICIGVGIKLIKREPFHCACLGTVLKVPLTKVSLAEYATMGAMALMMLMGVTF